MNWLRLGKRSEKVVAIADIGSGSVGLAITMLHDDAPASVLAASRGILPIEERSSDATASGIAELLSKVGADVTKAYAEHAGKHMRAVEDVFVIIRAPWSRSKTVCASQTFEKETVITDSMIGDLAKKALTEEKDIDTQNILEASVVRVELNGYPTGQPVGKRATSATVLALVSECGTVARTQVVGAIQKVFPHVTPQLRSSTRALVTVTREQANHPENYFVVDMGSDGASFFAVRRGAPSEYTLVAEGVRTILKRVAPSGMPEETFSLVRMLSRDQCSAAACEALQASIATAEPELVRIFGEGFAKCASLRRLPNDLLLVAHPDLVSWLSTFFSRIDFAQFTQTTQPFSVRTLSLPDLSAWVEPVSGVVPDAALALDIALVNIENNRSRIA